MAEPLKAITAGRFTLAQLAVVYSATGFEVEWLGLENEPEKRERFISDSHGGRDWVGEDDQLALSLMLTRRWPDLSSTCIVEVMCDTMHLRLSAAVDVLPGASRAAVYTYVNRVNRRLKLLRAYYDGRGSVVFDYLLLLTFGVRTEALVEATEFFMRVARRAEVELDRDGIILG